MTDRRIVCEDCHKHCEQILNLRLGNAGKSLGIAVARQEKRKPSYYDGFIDGIKEASGALRNETGLYWAELREQLER